METVQEISVDTFRVGSPLHWHFRTLPMEVQRGAIRRLALSGVSEPDIAARTGWSVDAVRRTLREDECIARLVAEQSTHIKKTLIPATGIPHGSQSSSRI